MSWLQRHFCHHLKLLLDRLWCRFLRRFLKLVIKWLVLRSCEGVKSIWYWLSLREVRMNWIVLRLHSCTFQLSLCLHLFYVCFFRNFYLKTFLLVILISVLLIFIETIFKVRIISASLRSGSLYFLGNPASVSSMMGIWYRRNIIRLLPSIR